MFFLQKRIYLLQEAFILPKHFLSKLPRFTLPSLLSVVQKHDTVFEYNEQLFTDKQIIYKK